MFTARYGLGQLRIWPCLQWNFRPREYVMPSVTVCNGNTRILSLTRYASVGGRACLNFCSKFYFFPYFSHHQFWVLQKLLPLRFEHKVYTHSLSTDVDKEYRPYAQITRSRRNCYELHSPQTLSITHPYRHVTPLQYCTLPEHIQTHLSNV